VTREEHLVVLVASAGLTILLTWPLAGGFTTLGRSDSGDARHGLWNVAWVAHALTTDPTHLFDANIFDPLPATLAYSEANIVAGVMALPVWITTGNPYAAMNSVSVLSFVLAAWITYALVKRITASRLGAAFAAIAFAFCPFIFSHFAHIQLLMSWTVPLVLLRMHAFVDTPRWPQSFLLGASMAIAGLACGYYGIFAGLAAGLGVLWFGLTNRRRDVTYWLGGLAAAAVAVAVVAPFFLPYVGIQAEGFGRTLAEARPNSADWRAYHAERPVQHADGDAAAVALDGDSSWPHKRQPGSDQRHSSRLGRCQDAHGWRGCDAALLRVDAARGQTNRSHRARINRVAGKTRIRERDATQRQPEPEELH
jgi:hypothetical protein